MDAIARGLSASGNPGLDQDQLKTADEIESIKSEMAALASKIAGAAKNKAGEIASENADDLKIAIQRNPMRSAVIAAGVGFIFGVLLAR